MMSTTNQTIFQQHPNIVSRKIAGEVILVPIRNNVADMDCIYTLNETAARYWELTDGKKTILEIHQQIFEEYDVTDAELALDLEELINTLVDIGALQKVVD